MLEGVFSLIDGMKIITRKQHKKIITTKILLHIRQSKIIKIKPWQLTITKY